MVVGWLVGAIVIIVFLSVRVRFLGILLCFFSVIFVRGYSISGHVLIYSNCLLPAAPPSHLSRSWVLL